MVSAFQMQSFYRAPLTVDTTNAQKFFDEEDASILDENILDHASLDSALEMSPPLVESRRDSFAVSSMFSPKSEEWQSVEMQSVPSNNPFFDQHSNNPFMRMDQSQQAAYQSHTWPMTSSGSATPLQTFDGLPAEYDSSTVPLFSRPAAMQVQTPFSNPSNQVALFQQLGAGQSLPTSPQKDHWMSQELKNQAMAKRTRPASPLIRSHNDLRRGDGIRKKNARFEIPSERNLSNIDQLISQSTDEQEIKELKQQKRLLRNRQAALDSRQRKKQHTERLEDEKKQFTEVITSMEEQIAKMEQDMAALMREKQQYENYIVEMERKQEDMIAAHTVETGELRKKINVLTNHVQSLESAAPPNAAGFTGAFGDMDGMTMDGSWDDMPMFDGFPMDRTAEVKQEMQIVPAKKPEVALMTDCEKPAQQGGLLFMLFLVGAFVLSSRSTPSIPRVSEDVRAASATILESVLKDAGVPHASSTLGAMAPQPSGTTWSQAAGSSSLPIAAPGLDNVAPSMLGDMVDSLTQPTEQQTNEQLFSLSVSQYNGLSSQDFPQAPPAEKSTSQGRRNLAEALANMRNTDKQSASEVYTRSLLWDQIPSDVVRTFAKMVAETNGQQGTAGRGSDGDT
ncbi:bZIP transcription factor 49 [Echria macrotheca]|uniref:BZIP transcription factor 49 n=1 Tax=Echria macrotheca TaxID=438768 RepID=A0AAJ0F8P8_9PEZI|nr:bZIP transcription factor 49 [Echria macrotheca]